MNRISIGYTLPVIGLLCTLAHTEGYAGVMGPVVVPATEKVYLGVFGGGGRPESVETSQFGTAFFDTPLAVDALGSTNTPSKGIVGGQLGYRWLDVPFFNTQWNVTPAFEFEGYYLGKSTFRADLKNRGSVLTEHDFSTSFPLDAGVFLTNAVVNFNSNGMQWLRPYVGVGVGGAVVRIENALSIQEVFPEPGLNHFNANPSDKDSAFAGQVKAGLNFNIWSHTNLFVEYRGLFLGNTHYTFGSTVAVGHVPTSSWAVNMNHQFYNMGAAGLQFSV